MWLNNSNSNDDSDDEKKHPLTDEYRDQIEKYKIGEFSQNEIRQPKLKQTKTFVKRRLTV